jgi:hypothetical protein
MQMHASADLGQVAAAAVQAEIDREKVLGGELVEPLDLKRLIGARGDYGVEASGVARCEIAIAPHAGGRNIAMDLDFSLLHRDAKIAGVGGTGDWKYGERVYEWGQLQAGKHRDRRSLRRCGRWHGHRPIHRHGHLPREDEASAACQCEGGGLLQKGAA